MNKLINTLFAASLVLSSYSVYAATTENNTDDGSAIGTADSPQHQRQQSRTDKGPTDVNQDSLHDDAKNLGNSESPQHVQQNKRTDKGASEAPKPRHHKSKNKVLKSKDENAGTTKGNPVQPSEPESAPPATN
ncbi:hypothetical protein Meth11DRAFT_0177 [Methylophilaceae bacterium 11]|uniref:hypothetical protein n=1 Tax=Methylotenera sp. 1P/1 TaxID=1131551 RepID=UPI00036789F6|nr:hypothetical protein [Methylotenera sp. 1P/1]EUJ09385.1 hypothetical protein Meth11DRAFT_0177 [Methylophilaceae bacterium 11]